MGRQCRGDDDRAVARKIERGATSDLYGEGGVSTQINLIERSDCFFRRVRAASTLFAKERPRSSVVITRFAELLAGLTGQNTSYLFARGRHY